MHCATAYAGRGTFGSFPTSAGYFFYLLLKMQALCSLNRVPGGFNVSTV